MIFRYHKPGRTCGTTKRNANRNRPSDIHSHQTQQKPKETHPAESDIVTFNYTAHLWDMRWLRTRARRKGA
ncbi:NinE family protein [Klebsiella oxytoca]|uniref:NinE family protein n=1 Tax=Klebsiella oxytoca TaxID=571 RepID=UPI0034D1F5BA